MPVRKPLFLDLQGYGAPTEASLTDTLTVGLFKAAGVGGVAFDANSNRITNLADPTSASDAVTKGYADNIAQGITLIPSVRALASGNQTLSGLPIIDGVQLVAGDRVLLIGQTNAVTNGVYVVQSGAWTRPTASAGVSDWTTGRGASSLAMFVREGTSFADQGYTCITDGNPKIDTDPVSFTQYTGLGEVTTGQGLQKSSASGNTISAVLASASGLQFTSGAIDTLLNPAGGLAKAASGLAVTVNANQTLAVDSNGLKVLGVPSQFTVGGTATSTNVSAANLGTLTAGTASLADSLHSHQNVNSAKAVVESLTSGSALSAGDPVYWTSTASTLGKASASSGSTSLVVGIAAAAISANGQGLVVRRGIVDGVISGATPGTVYYLATGTGGLTATIPSDAGSSVVRIGVAVTASALDVNPQLLTVRSAA